VGQRRALTYADRTEIATGRKAGWGIRRIARQLARDPSVVSREVARNSYLTAGYQSVHADCEAERNRSRPPGVEGREGPGAAGPGAGRPEAGTVAAGDRRAPGRGARPGLVPPVGAPSGHPGRVSHEAVYSYVYALPKSELTRHGIRLDSKRTKRRPARTAGQRQGPIIGMVSIDQRPDDVDDRKIPGHWEGNLIIGKAGATAAATLVERTTRFLAIQALPMGRGSEAVADAVIDHTSVLPAMCACLAISLPFAAATDIKI